MNMGLRLHIAVAAYGNCLWVGEYFYSLRQRRITVSSPWAIALSSHPKSPLCSASGLTVWVHTHTCIFLHCWSLYKCLCWERYYACWFWMQITHSTVLPLWLNSPLDNSNQCIYNVCFMNNWVSTFTVSGNKLPFSESIQVAQYCKEVMNDTLFVFLITRVMYISWTTPQGVKLSI